MRAILRFFLNLKSIQEIMGMKNGNVPLNETENNKQSSFSSVISISFFIKTFAKAVNNEQN